MMYADRFTRLRSKPLPGHYFVGSTSPVAQDTTTGATVIEAWKTHIVSIAMLYGVACGLLVGWGLHAC